MASKQAKAADSIESSSPQKKNFLKRHAILLILILVLLATATVAGYFYLQYQSAQKLASNPRANSEVAEITEKVGKLIELPTGEEVTLASVSDVTKLKDQKFFAHAQNGDKVLIYTKAGKAILYRPTTNKVIEVGPINVDATAPSTEASTAQVSSPLKIALYNGTKTNGLTTRVEDILKTMSSLQTQVVIKQNATGDFSESVVVDLTGKNKQAATQLATFSKGKVAVLPSGETRPEGADILIILGQSYVGEVTPASSPTPTP